MSLLNLKIRAGVGVGLARIALCGVIVAAGLCVAEPGTEAGRLLAIAGAQQTEQDARLSGGRPKFGPPPGMAEFQQTCSGCHTAEGLQMGGRIVPTLSALQAFPPERIYEAMTTGKMQTQAAGLSAEQKREVAEFLAGRKIVDTVGTSVAKMSNRCPSNPPIAGVDLGPAWNGWSPGPDNARFQSASSAGLSAAQTPKLKLKWAFGLPGGASSFSQPTIVADRVFVGSDNSAIYALNAKSGCALWSFHADSPGRFAPIVAPIHTPDAKYAVYFASERGIAYAVNAQNGALIWKSPLQQPVHVSASPAFFDGRLYVPLTGTETVAGSNPSYECCKSRGGVAAFDGNTGKLIWRVDSLPEPLAKLGKNSAGVQLWGPSGASVWNTPTIDPKRKLLYVGTGNNYGPDPSSTSDSILALSLKDGHIVWRHQEVAGDSFMLGCGDTNPAGENCPKVIGKDWDFGGASAILQTLPDGQDILVDAGKAGIAVAVDPNDGRVIWRTKLYGATPPTADGLVLFGGVSDGRRVYYPLQQPGGGLEALDLATGHVLWNIGLNADGRGQIGAASGIPGMIFTGGWDGVLRAVTDEGRLVWSYDTRHPYSTVNGVPAHGGSLGSAGPTIADGMLYVVSGYVGMQNGAPGNVLLAFAPE